MVHFWLFLSFEVSLCPLVQSANTDLDSTNHETVNDLVSEYLIDNFSASLSAMNLRKRWIISLISNFQVQNIENQCYCLLKSLEATLLKRKRDLNMDDKDHVESCCYFPHICDAFKHTELDRTIELNIRYCECVHSSWKCLKNLNTSFSNAGDHPIIECTKFKVYSFMFYLTIASTPGHKKYLNRCLKYELDESQPQKIQLFDVAIQRPWRIDYCWHIHHRKFCTIFFCCLCCMKFLLVNNLFYGCSKFSKIIWMKCSPAKFRPNQSYQWQRWKWWVKCFLSAATAKIHFLVWILLNFEF